MPLQGGDDLAPLANGQFTSRHRLKNTLGGHRQISGARDLRQFERRWPRAGGNCEATTIFTAQAAPLFASRTKTSPTDLALFSMIAASIEVAFDRAPSGRPLPFDA
jgi:hypothetical protein